jgi:hypothetical protein
MSNDSSQFKKPLSLYLVAAGYLGAMVLNIAQIYLQGRHVYPHDIVFLVLYPAAAYGIVKVRRWGWYLVVAHIIFLLVANTVIAVNFGFLGDQLFIQLNLLLLFFLWFFLRRSVRSPFHNPALRWWERQQPRYGATFRVVLRTSEGDAINADGINLSTGGCFVKLAGGQTLTQGDRLELELKYEDFEPFHTKGRVSWASPGSEFNPRGIGIAFSRPDRANRIMLKAIMQMVEARWVKSAQGAPA